MWNDLKGYVQSFVASLKSEEGQGLVEYALIISLVSIASILALTSLGTAIGGVFENIVTKL